MHREERGEGGGISKFCQAINLGKKIRTTPDILGDYFPRIVQSFFRLNALVKMQYFDNSREQELLMAIDNIRMAVGSTVNNATLLYRISSNMCNATHPNPKAWSEHGVEALWTGQKNILLSCPQCLDSMLAPGFWTKVY